ncbi:hypothetical protein DPMN_089528 [Dreissena polymorpha]|uniref:Uncharacterized protein n=1 Tax=Dreissena polymorpha TaxID=45954 RepID=A0A9D4KYI1_DREPO|nr:hypothetical protein DPMN_089528 [Dreissena polymorpha]
MFSSSKRHIVYMNKAENLCPHLEILKSHKYIWENELLNSAIASSSNEQACEDDTEETEALGLDETNKEDLTAQPVQDQDIKGHHFNPESGLLEYPSLSKEWPLPDGCASLRDSIQAQSLICDRMNGRDGEGFLFTNQGGLEKLRVCSLPAECSCGVRCTCILYPITYSKR